MSQQSKNPDKSTNVRSFNIVRKVVSRTLWAGSRVAPGLTAALAERVFFTPPKATIRGPGQPRPGYGEPFTLHVGNTRLEGWTWGTGPAVMLLHGWGSRGSRLASFVEPLVESGLRAVTFDAPAHGSSGGKRTNLREFATAISAVSDHIGDVHGLITHSFGGTAAALAMSRGLPVSRAVFVAPAADLAYFSRGFADQMQFGSAARNALERRIERRIEIPWKRLTASGLASDQRTPLLIIHDRHDPDVPWRQAAQLHRHWPNARLVTTRGLGHRAVVRDPAVVERAISFVTVGSGQRGY